MGWEKLPDGNIIGLENFWHLLLPAIILDESLYCRLQRLLFQPVPSTANLPFQAVLQQPARAPKATPTSTSGVRRSPDERIRCNQHRPAAFRSLKLTDKEWTRRMHWERDGVQAQGQDHQSEGQASPGRLSYCCTVAWWGHSFQGQTTTRSTSGTNNGYTDAVNFGH